MVYMQALGAAAVLAGIAVPLQDNCSDDMPFKCRQSDAIIGPQVGFPFFDVGTGDGQKWGQDRSHGAPLSTRHACNRGEIDPTRRFVEPHVQQQKAKSGVFGRGEVKRGGEIVADVEL